MIGDPAQFEAIGNRLGFRIVEETEQRLKLVWQGARFPAFLCLGIALMLLFISVPIVQALYIRGFVGPAGSLWYFPAMNLVLFGIAGFLISQRRSIVVDSASRAVELQRRSVYRKVTLQVSYDEIARITLGVDQVFSGFAVAGSTADQSFPTPALRLTLANGDTALLDRGSFRRLEDLGKRLSLRSGKEFAVTPEVIDALKPVRPTHSSANA